jgi:hypothetical protein
VVNDQLTKSVNHFATDATPRPDGQKVKTPMSLANQVRWDLPLVQASRPDTTVQEGTTDRSLTKALRLVAPLDGREADAPPVAKVPREDWSKLVDRIRDVANHTRQVEAGSREQDVHVQHLLDRAREDIMAAGARVQAADTRVAEIQARSEALLRAADERVKAAEERVRIAEGWLAQVYETIVSEFSIGQDTKQIA